MPSVTTQLNTNLGSSTLDSDLQEQVDAFTAIIEVVAQLIENPPDDIGDLTAVLGDTDTPEFAGVATLIGVIEQLTDDVPDDPSVILEDVTSGLSDITASVDNSIVTTLDLSLQVALAIYQLTQINFDVFLHDESPADGESGGTDETDDTDGGTTASPATPPIEPSTVVRINTILDAIPADGNINNIMLLIATLLDEIVASIPTDAMRVPLLDEIHEPLSTLISWQSGDATSIKAEIVASLETLEASIQATLDVPLTDIGDLATTLLDDLPIADFQSNADNMAVQFNALADALEADALATTPPIVTELNVLMDAYELIQAEFDATLGAQSAEFQLRLDVLVTEIVTRMESLVMALAPDVSMGNLGDVIHIDSAPLQSGIEEITTSLNHVVAWLQSLVGRIDLSAVQQPLENAATAINEMADEFDASLINITLEVQALFSDVEATLDSINVTQIEADIQAQITEFRDLVITNLQSVFESARQAVSDVVNEIDLAVSDFDPEAVVAALQNVVTIITDTLNDPDLQAAITEVRDALEQATQALRELSFAPLIDQVIDEMETVSDGIRSVTQQELNEMLRSALKAALEVIPTDITPLIDPLLDEFDTLVEEGPVKLLESVKDEPRKLFDEIEKFRPSILVEDSLGKPFNDLMTELDQFKPSQLLAPLDDELDTFKNRLADEANPAQLIDELVPLYAQLMTVVDQLKPSQIVTALEAQINAVVNEVIEALPIDEAFDQAQAAINAVGSVVAYADMIKTILNKVVAISNSLSDAPNTVRTWVEDILSPLDSLGNLDDVQIVLGRIDTAIDATRALQILTQFDDVLASLVMALDDFNPPTRLGAIISAQGRVTASLNGMPASPEVTAIADLNARIVATAPDFGEPFGILQELRDALQATRDELNTALGDWDMIYHVEGSVLAELHGLSATADSLRSWVMDFIEPQFIEPFGQILSSLSPLGDVFEGIAEQIDILVTTLQTELDISAPLQAIKDSLEAVIARLQNFNLDVVEQGIQDVFDNVKSKFDILNPQPLRDSVDTAFNDMLDAIDLSTVLPQAEIDQLDETYQEVVDKLRALSPTQLVVDVVEPAYVETVTPLIEAFDVSDLLNAIIERLADLADELKAELDRVQAAFDTMLSAVAGV